MTTSTPSINVSLLRKGPIVVLGCTALAVLSSAVHAHDHKLQGEIPQITISSPVVTVVGHRDDLTPVEEVTVTARVSFDPVTLTTNSGVALLRDRVRVAARRVCTAADPQDVEDDETCIQRAVKGTDKQVDAAIAAAKSTARN